MHAANWLWAFVKLVMWMILPHRASQLGHASNVEPCLEILMSIHFSVSLLYMWMQEMPFERDLSLSGPLYLFNFNCLLACCHCSWWTNCFKMTMHLFTPIGVAWKPRWDYITLEVINISTVASFNLWCLWYHIRNSSNEFCSAKNDGFWRESIEIYIISLSLQVRQFVKMLWRFIQVREIPMFRGVSAFQWKWTDTFKSYSIGFNISMKESNCTKMGIAERDLWSSLIAVMTNVTLKI